MIEIKDFKFNIVCDFDNRIIARHSIGNVNAPANLRTNICTQCLIEIITEGLKRLTDEEKTEILKDYILETNEMAEVQADDHQEQESDSLQEPIDEENKEVVQTIAEEPKKPQKLDKEADIYNPIGKPRDELIEKAKELGIEGKIVTFTNKMLENEIEKKLKTGGK
jgi:hypothetical protein